MTRYDRATLERLRFRRQFILGTRFADAFPAWQRTKIGATLHLTAHPDLNVTHVSNGVKSVTLLGYILDPANPTAGNDDILGELLGALQTFDGFFEQTTRFGGRWALVVNDGTRTVVFGDAAGLRQVVYTEAPASRQVWCGSQAGLVSEVAEVPVDREALAFLQMEASEDHQGLIWPPGDTTACMGIKRLLPNHYLDLRTGRSQRYWPHSDLPRISLRRAIPQCADILSGLMESARRRFQLVLPMTAGWDSRLLLAASRPMAKQMSFFTAVFPHMTESHPDVATPAALLRKLGLEHEILDCRGDVDDAFSEIYKRNVLLGHERYLPFAQALFDQTPNEAVCVKGDIAEIAKCYLRLDRPREREITATNLATLTELPAHPFLIDALDGWLAEVRGHCYNVPLLDLFFWEQEAGRLHEMLEAECDIAREAFAPLNCRKLLETMLSVPEPHRKQPTFDLFGMLIHRFWPETLEEPINGRCEQDTEATVRRALVRLGLLQLLPKSVKSTAKTLLKLVS